MTSTENTNETSSGTKDIKGETSNGSLSIKGTPEFEQLPNDSSTNKFLFMASIKAPYYREENRANVDLICVLDESSSMSGEAIELLKETTQFIAKNLESGDRLGIVGYNDTASIRLQLTKMDQKGKLVAEKEIGQIKASGCTNLSGGLLLAIKMMRSRTTKNPVSSIMLLTDGQANRGLTDVHAIIKAMKNPDPQDINMTSRDNINLVTNYSNLNINTMPNFPLLQQQGIPNIAPVSTKSNSSWFQNKSNKIMQKMQFKNSNSNQSLLPTKQGEKSNYNSNSSTDNNNTNKNLNQNTNSNSEGQTRKTNKTDNDDTKTTDVGEDDVESEIPCFINTFGFGENHNEALLEKLATEGRGMYAFIENTDEISKTFAECLGGLVSTVAENIVLKIETLNGVKINKCLSQGYSIRSIVSRQKYEISVRDLQSEESRDIVFELTVPKINKSENLKDWKAINLFLEYKNLVKSKNEIIQTFSCINRSTGIKETGERNYELDLQANRLIAANSMQQANELGKNGKLEKAREILKNAKLKINNSRSCSSVQCVNLVKDLEKCKDSLRTHETYSSYGNKVLIMNSNSHHQQRSTNSMTYRSQSSYTNNSKTRMINSFQTKSSHN